MTLYSRAESGFTRFSGKPLTVTLNPRGSNHDKPSGLMPKGMTIPLPEASSADTDVRLPARSVTLLATGIEAAAPEMRLTG